ncbi:hypothetical protein VTK26DRAFT_1129 [Humicola hyalothermophila]
MSQPSHPTLINLPQPPSNPGTPSEIPGTPTSTTTSLSALSTTAIKDGHRGALHHLGHLHSPSSNTLEAERADRISRLTGLSSVTTLRNPVAGAGQFNAGPDQATPTSTEFAANVAAAAAAAGLTPAYFDAAGQPVADKKVSTIGSASATESVSGQTTTSTEVGGDRDTLPGDEDMLTELDSASASGYMAGEGDAMDEDQDNLATRSIGGFEDRMSDDGSASLVGFGEGAGSTVSGPIYQRRPLPPQQQQQQQATNTSASPGGATAAVTRGLERSSSGFSEGDPGASSSPGHYQYQRHPRQTARGSDRDTNTGTDTPVSQSAVRERNEARMMDGVAVDSSVTPPLTAASAPATKDSTNVEGADDNTFVDTTTQGPVPVQPHSHPHHPRRQQQHPHHHHQPSQPSQLAPSQTQPQHRHQPSHSPPTMLSPRETAERIVGERLDGGEARVGSTALGSPKGNEGPLGRFYFESH